MKRFLLLPIVLCALFLPACSGNTTTAAVSGGGSSGDSTYTGDNVLSYTIDGRQHTIKDMMHDGDGKNWAALFLVEVKNHTDQGMVEIKLGSTLSHEVFNFTVPNHSGVTQVVHYSPTLGTFSDKKTNVAEYMSAAYKNYYGDDVTVTITEIDATHVVGTFSGKYLSEDKKPLEISGGKFDVQFTKDNP